ncbi:hypothetical protein [Janthinobacterium sp.]|uniref:hypothetical protein n=1 Tax=Janthinobacterium sp. TaxID=1871054 RepID=UPI0028968E26|nr:hypothetical protein [Janthinobacterium sp.]
MPAVTRGGKDQRNGMNSSVKTAIQTSTTDREVKIIFVGKMNSFDAVRGGASPAWRVSREEGVR